MSEPIRFVVFSHGRAGTNFLMHNLMAHPDTRIHMEPFNEAEGRSAVDGVKWQKGESSADFAYTHAFRDVDNAKRAAGFKLFYFHCRQDPVSADIWQALLEDREVRMIYLNRRNLLNKCLSALRAEKSGVWHPKGGDYLKSAYGEIVDIEVNIPWLMRAMTNLYCGYHRVAETFKAHRNIHFHFEDLELQNERMLSDVYRFLDLDPQPVAHPFRSGTLTRETTRIVNESEVRDAISSSVFSDYLNTCPLL